MKHMFVVPGHNKASMGRKSVDKENSPRRSVSGGKRNQCVIFPANVIMVAEALGRRNQNCIVRTKVASDLIIKLGDFSFHLHKLPMVSRSGYLNRLILQNRYKGEKENSLHIQIDNFPGGIETFELIVKFCYGWKVDLTASNVAPLYCAAHFMEMSDDFEQGNLISKTEAFLSFVLFSSWKDMFQVLRSCESISSWAKQLQIVKRCSEAIAWKACTSPEAISVAHDDAYECLSVLLDNANSEVGCDRVDKYWWFEDVSCLRIDHFILVVESIKKKGMKPELVGSCIAHWTAKWLSRITFGMPNLTPKHLSFQLQRVTAECLIKVLPVEKNSVSCNFLLHLLKAGLATKIDSEFLGKLERRAASMLETSRVLDILVKNYGDEEETVYDVKIVVRVVKSYVSCVLSNHTSRVLSVGKLLDGYLALVAGDQKLSLENFRALVEALPKDARQSHDNLYRAIDMYFKAHPSVTEEERASVCKAIENHKLSREAREHAMHNERMPLNTTTRLILLEQVIMTKSMTATGSNFRRTRSQTVIRVDKGPGKGWIKEINTMKREVETMKLQLSELHMCKLKLQSQARSFVV